MQKVKKKKWLSVLLAVVLAAALLPTMAYATGGTGTMESVYLNGASGSDENSGADSASAVKTLDKAMELVADDGVIYICGQVTVDSALTVSDVKIERAAGYGGALITVNSGAELTISNTVIDGKKADETNATGYLVNVYNGTLNVQNGTQLINNNATAVYVNNISYFNMTGGVISGNMIENPIEDFYYSGAGIYNAGITVISGGEISNNTVTNYDGGAIRNDRGTLTLGGNAVVKENKALSGAAISTSGGAKTILQENASIENNTATDYGAAIYLTGFTNYDQVPATFEMTGGTITGNTVESGYGGAIFGYYIDGETVIDISGGTIEGNQAESGGDGIAVCSYDDTVGYPTINLSGTPNIVGGISLWDGEYEPGYQINVTGDFEPVSPIVIERYNTATDIAAVNYAAGVTPDANDFAAHNLTDILVIDGQTIEWREGKIVYFYDADGTEYSDYRHGVITGGTIDTANVPAVTKSGYTFLGWIAEGETEHWDFAIDTVTDTTELYAVWSLNAPTVTIAADSTAVHEGTPATLTAAPAHDAANVTYTYQWYKDGVAIANATESTLAAMESGSYTVKVTATDGTNTSVEAESNTVEITVEKHTFGTSWKSDADNHWHECDVCGDKADIAAHDYEWVTDKEATETAAGSRHEQCTICGYAKAAVEIPATGDSEEPDTGDSANIAVWALLCGVSAIGAYVTTRARKEKTK